MKINVMKRGYELHPLGNDAIEKLSGIENGEYLIDFRKDRNPQHHRLFFTMLQKAFENQERYDNIEDLLIEVKLKCGWYQEHITTKGKIVYIPKSIAFENMDQNEFKSFYDKAVNVIGTVFGIDVENYL